MKPQKKATVARKATKVPAIAKKRRSFLEKTISDIRKEKKPKKLEKVEDTKKKLESDKKKLEKAEEKKKVEDKKKIEEKRKEKSEKVDEKKKCIKDHEKKVEEKKLDKMEEKIVDEHICDSVEKKKVQKSEEKVKIDKQIIDNKKKVEKIEDKKKNGKFEDENAEDQMKLLDVTEDNNLHEEKVNIVCPNAKKKCKDERKKDGKLIKPDIKESIKLSVIKDKKSERKKLLEKGSLNINASLTQSKKDSKTKSMQKKGISKKTVLTKKPQLSVVQKVVDKKIKLDKLVKEEETSISEEDEAMKKAKRKNVNVSKAKIIQEKKPKLGKHMKAKLPLKNNKINTVLKKDDKLKTLVEKVIPKKKVDSKEIEKSLSEHKKILGKDESNEEMSAADIKNELEDEKDVNKSSKEEQLQPKSQDAKKVVKSPSKISKKISSKKKTVKVQMENANQTISSSEDTSSEESAKQIKVCENGPNDSVPSSKEEQIDGEHTIETNSKDEAVKEDNISGNLLSSGTEDENEEDARKNKKEIKRKERGASPPDERVSRMRLFGFWTGPKRHRVASLNALAKVHCLYENETGGAYLGGYCKPKSEKEKQKKTKEEKDENVRKEKEKKIETKTEETIPKRKLRNVPGLRGKHWDMLESSSSSSSSDDDYEKSEKNTEPSKKKIIKRRKRNEEVMDLKDMVVCKRMASLNASAILAASYSDEKNPCDSDSSDSSSGSEVEIIKRRKQNDSDIDKRKSKQNADQDDVLKPNKLVILNQDTDVTITGVYVNQTRSTHHEGFCSIAGMQYRISSTSHTQTAATAVATELHDQQKLEQPCKSYTPLGALSSMQPPGSQGNHPNMSPRRHSAFSAPHQHGYYQPAGPLIQHPPTLPPIKGPPPEPTPTPPQNSEGSDDLVATSTTSGGTSSTGGGFYRAYCPQYYGTPPQYPDLCYPPTYSHPHAHPPPYYKYAPTYRRQYYGYQESGGGGGPGSGATAGGPAVVDYQPPPPPPSDYPLPPYYGAYPPPPPPPPPPPNPAYLHSQGRPFVDHAAFQGCPCPMQSCPKNVDTGPLIGNGKGAPVVSGTGLSLPPSALVGPPSPARGLAGLAPPHGANAWDTDRVQLNTHRNLNQNQPSVVPTSRNLGHNCPRNSDCKNKDEKNCSGKKLQKCEKHACSSTYEVKLENLSPSEKLAVTTCPSNKFHNFKLENNNVKCESCSVEMGENLSCVGNCNVKCESEYKCDIMKCEQCMKESQMAILEIDKDSGIMLDEKLDTDTDVKEEFSDVVAVVDSENWKKPDYEPTVQEETIEKPTTEESAQETVTEEEHPKCQKVTKRKLSLDSLSDCRKKRKVSKRTLSVDSSQDLNNSDFSSKISVSPVSPVLPVSPIEKKVDNTGDDSVVKKKQLKKDNHNQKRKVANSNCSENATKKSKTSKNSTSNNIQNCLKHAASDNSIMETINNVIQQSLQITKKKDRKSKSNEKSEKMKKEMNLLSAMKKVARKVDLMKELASEKLSKVISKGGHGKGKTETRTKSKTQEKNKSKGKGKSKVYEAKAKDSGKKHESTTKSKACQVYEFAKKPPAVIKKKRKSTKKLPPKKSGSKVEDSVAREPRSESLVLTRKTFLKPKWSNGWSWEGDAFEAKVYLTNEESAIRRCYASMKHESGDVLRARDCVLLKSGARKADLPFVAKIAALWENPDDGEMMFSLLWYYRPEHTEQGRTQHDTEDEVFASRHRDANSVACIEDKCYILTFNEYCRYRKNLRRIEEGLESPGLIVPPGDQPYPRENRLPPIPVPSDMVLFCRRVYDYRGKKLVKNPG